MGASVALAAGCGQGPIDDTSGTVYFSPLESEAVAARTLAEPAIVPADELEKIRPILDGFRQNAEQLFSRPDIEQRLPQIESVFVTTGHYLDLVGIYQNVVDKQGISSQATPRLGWALVRLGQRPQARSLIDQMIASDPTDATAWFLNGAYWMAEASDSQEAGALTVASWQRTLELDENFKGYEQLDAAAIRQQIGALRQSVSDEAVAKAEAKLDEPAGRAVAESNSPADAPEADAPEPVAEPSTQPEAPAEPARALAAAEPAPAAAPSPQPAAKAEPVPVTIARAEMALAEEDADKANRLFEQALQADPSSVEARLGLIRAGWLDEAKRNDLAAAVRELAERDDLSARQQYEVGLFAYSKMQDRQLAARLWQDAKQRDPDLAKSVDLDGLLSRVAN